MFVLNVNLLAKIYVHTYLDVSKIRSPKARASVEWNVLIGGQVIADKRFRSGK